MKRGAVGFCAFLCFSPAGGAVFAQNAATGLPRQTSIDAAGGPIVVTPFMHATVQIDHGGRVIQVDQIVTRFDAEHAAIVKLHTASANQPLGAAPVVVLTPANVPDRGWKAMQEQLATLSSNASSRRVATPGGDLHLSEPAAVVRAVGDVVTAVRQRGSVPRH